MYLIINYYDMYVIRLASKENLKLQRLPWQYTNHKDICRYIPNHRDISLTTEYMQS